MLRGHLSRTVITCLTTALLPVGAVAAPAHATSHSPAQSGIELTTSAVKLESSTGHTLRAQITLQRFATDDNSAFFSVDVWDSEGESHQWELQVADKTLTYSAAAGRGTVAVAHKQIAPLGTVSLAIAAQGKATTHTCPDGDSYTRQPVTLAGTFSFHTQSKAWGTLGSPTRRTTFDAPSTMQTDYGQHESCFDPEHSACQGVISWGGSATGNTLLFGFVGRYHGEWASEIAFDKSRSLTKPLGASRDDYADMLFHKHPRLNTGSAGQVSLEIRGAPHGLVSGSAKLISVGPEATENDLCRGGTSKTWNARFVIGSQPLTAHLQFGGALTAKNGTDGVDIVEDS